MTKVLEILKSSPAACAFCLSFGIGIMLSVAYLDPRETWAIALRHTVGGVFLLLPGIVQKFYHPETE